MMVSCELNSHWRQVYFSWNFIRHLNANFVQNFRNVRFVLFMKTCMTALNYTVFKSMNFLFWQEKTWLSMFWIFVIHVTQMKSKDLSDLSSIEFSFLFFFMAVINRSKCQWLVYNHTSIYYNLILFNDSKYVSHSIDSLYKLQSKRLVRMSVSLCTEFMHLLFK